MDKKEQSGDDALYKKLARNNYDKAFETVELALNQIRAYVAEKPANISASHLGIIAGLGKEVGEAAIGLEQRIIALKNTGFFSK